MGRRRLYALETFWCVWDAITGLNLTCVQWHPIFTSRVPWIWGWVLFFWMMCAPQTSRGQIAWGVTVCTTYSLFIRGKGYSNAIYNQDIWISALILLFTEKKKYCIWLNCITFNLHYSQMVMYTCTLDLGTCIWRGTFWLWSPRAGLAAHWWR